MASPPWVAPSARGAVGIFHPQNQLHCWDLFFRAEYHSGRMVRSVTIRSSCWRGSSGLPLARSRQWRSHLASRAARAPVRGGGAGVHRRPAPAPRPPAKIDGTWHSPQPMSVPGGPWNQLLRLLKSRPLGCTKAEQSLDCPGGAGALPPPTGGRTAPRRGPHRTDPRGAELSCSLAHRPGPARHHHLRGTHGDQETLKEFGVSGAGKSRVRRGGLLCLGNVFSSSDYLDPVPGRRLQ